MITATSLLQSCMLASLAKCVLRRMCTISSFYKRAFRTVVVSTSATGLASPKTDQSTLSSDRQHHSIPSLGNKRQEHTWGSIGGRQALAGDNTARDDSSKQSAHCVCQRADIEQQCGIEVPHSKHRAQSQERCSGWRGCIPYTEGGSLAVCLSHRGGRQASIVV